MPTFRELGFADIEGTGWHAIRDKSTGDLKGVSHDLGKALAARLEVPFEPMLFGSLATMLDAGRAGTWDAAFLGTSPERRGFLDFTSNHIEVEYGYLVPAGSRLATKDDVDRTGVQKPAMHGISAQLPGSRVLDGPAGSEGVAMAMPKGRGAAAAGYARSFIEEARSSGLIGTAIERTGLRGVLVASGD